MSKILLLAHHRDINRASALLEGVQGWHITGRKRTGNRKDKRRCKHYAKSMNGCNLNHNRVNSCVGAGNCASYHE